MYGFTVFGLELLASAAVSTVILLRLQALLRDVGLESCERGARGATVFWVAYTQLMMLVAPLLLISLFSHAGTTLDTLGQLKSSIALVLSGQFAGLVLVGRAVWKSIVREAPRPAAPASAPHLAAA